MLSLDGVVIRMHEMRVEMQMELKDKDMSGQSSATDTAEQGDKGKQLTFTGLVPFKDSLTLTQIYQFAGTKNDNGQRHIYRIGNDIARVLKIRQVKFSGRINAREHESQMAWIVSFSLREHHSVAEQREQREKQQSDSKLQSPKTDQTQFQQALAQSEEVNQ